MLAAPLTSHNWKSRPGRPVAVVIPIYRLPLTPDEEISIRHLREYLAGFDRYVIGLEHVPNVYADFELRPFPLSYFKDIHSYSQLLLSENFYRAFADYEYILIYQLDCLVFSSALEDWCREGWDYVGAPWFRNHGQDPVGGFWAVGNGGLSLRRVSSALKVLTSTKRILDDPRVRGLQTDRFDSVPQLKRVHVALRTFLFHIGYHNNLRWLMREFKKSPYNEDLFWAFHARKLVPSFNIPAPERAVAFSFEMSPRYCFQQNSNRLPFGCHGWAKYDREFWEPYLLR